jgi:hypothetical protein
MRLPRSWYSDSHPQGHTLGYFLDMKSKAFASRRLSDGSIVSTRHHFDGLGFRVDSASCIRDVGNWIMQTLSIFEQEEAGRVAQIARKLAQDAHDAERKAERAALLAVELAAIDASIARLSDLHEPSLQDDAELMNEHRRRRMNAVDTLLMSLPSPTLSASSMRSPLFSYRRLAILPYFSHVHDGPSDGLLQLLTFDKIGLDAWAKG